MMTKDSFLSSLRARLEGLPEEDVEKTIEYYSEMIDDRLEEGGNEEEIVSSLGSPEDAAAAVWQNASIPKLVKEKVRTRRRRTAGEIILLILGAPLWIPLLLTVLIVFFTLYLVLWVVIASVYIVDIALLLSGLAAIAGGVLLIGKALVPAGIFTIAAAVALIGLTLLLLPLCNLASRGIFKLGQKFFALLKVCFFGKGGKA